jgi:RNA polymerase sigma-54 factor
VEQALTLVQGFDPAGVAARSVRECLLLQVRAAPVPDALAVTLLEHHFETLAGRRRARLSRVLRASPSRLLAAIGHIAALEAAPGLRFERGERGRLVPDVLIRREGDQYRIAFSDDELPRPRLHALYRALRRRSGAPAPPVREEGERPDQWPLRDVEQRQRTLRRVAESIVRFQREFLDKGLMYLRPLVLRDVATDIGVHESTVSRVTARTHAQTPRGTYPLRFFFQSGIAADAGGRVSSASVKALIRECVAVEDPAKPLSDVEIASRLRERGLSIARRTVAKYRIELRIPPSPHRHQAAPVPRG